MKTVDQIKQDFSAARSVVARTEVEGVKKLKAFRQCVLDLSEIEKAAARDFAFPLGEIQEARRILPEVQDLTSYMEERARSSRWVVS